MTLASIVILGICSLAQGAVTFTQDVIVASGAEVSYDNVKINPVGGEVDIAYRNTSGQIVFRSYLSGSSLSSSEIVDSSSCYWLAGIGRGEGKIKIGYNKSNVLRQAYRSLEGTGWTSASTGHSSIANQIVGSYAVKPATGLGGFVARASDASAYYIAEASDGTWGGFVSFLDSASGGTYPDLIYRADDTPYVGMIYGKVSGAGPNAWGGALTDLRALPDAAYPYFHSALAEHDGVLYFARARTTSVTSLYYTDAQGNWVSDGQITSHGYYGDYTDYAMDVSPSGKIAVMLLDQRDGDTSAALYLATKDGLGGQYTWEFTRLADGIYHCPDVKFDAAGNLYMAYYDSADDSLHLKTTVLTATPEQFGAVGDGINDDTDAFCAAAQAIYTQGSGSLTLTAGKTYRVGRQYHEDGQYPYYKTATMFSLNNSPVKQGLWVVIEGNGATVKMNDGMRIGSFDKDTGDVYIPASMPFTLSGYRSDPGLIFGFDQCSRVRIQNMVIDGNNQSMILGGLWGDMGRQCLATGVILSSCDYLRINNLTSSNCGLDGIVLKYPGLTEESPSQDWAVSNSRFEYNARQGMSWAGGKGLAVTDCKFNHTGRGPFSSAPGGGLDIEAENSVNRNGSFVSCDFVNNTGCAMVADSGNTQNVTFDDCLFWGTTNWSIWPQKPGMKFNSCDIYGTAVNAYPSDDATLATQFTNCHFEDVDGTYDGIPLTSYRRTALAIFNGNNILFDNCTLVANQIKSLYLDGGGTQELVRNCTITHKWAACPDHSYQCLLRGTDINNTTFHEASLAPGLFYIVTEYLHVGPGVYVDGPQCKWTNWSWGITGWIPEN